MKSKVLKIRNLPEEMQVPVSYTHLYVTGFMAEYLASQDRIERDPYHEKAASIQQETSGWFPLLMQKLTASSLEIYQIGG